MNRLIEKTVFSGLVMDWRLATCPTSRSPLLVNATTDGVVRAPSWLAMTVGCPPSITATTELVVPKSIPIIFPIRCVERLLVLVWLQGLLLNVSAPLSSFFSRRVTRGVAYQP